VEPVWLEEAGWGVARGLIELYHSDPLSHCYLLYDMIYEASRSRILVGVEEGRAACYLLYWSPGGYAALHLWGACSVDLLGSIGGLLEGYGRVFVHLGEGIDPGPVEEYLRGLGYSVSRETLLDMVVGEDGFKPRMVVEPVRLGPGSLDDYLALMRLWGRRMTRERALELLSRQRFYGVYLEGRLVAVAGTYLRLPEVWVIGSVYVHPDYRRRGLGSSVVSAVTRDAVQSGAHALLHVEESNTPARRLYESLGYRVAARKWWVFGRR